jgi:hypothetical protein
LATQQQSKIATLRVRTSEQQLSATLPRSLLSVPPSEPTHGADMSNKRPNVLEHVRREEEYMENSKNNDPPDPVRKATAAQLAARK